MCPHATHRNEALHLNKKEKGIRSSNDSTFQD